MREYPGASFSKLTEYPPDDFLQNMGQMKYGNTPLHMIVRSRVVTAKFIASSDTSIPLSSPPLVLPLLVAKGMEKLRENTLFGINNRNSAGHTPLMCAVLSKNIDAVKMLLRYVYLDTSITDMKGNTALLMAAATSVEITKILVASGGFRPNKNGVNPIMAAICSKYLSCDKSQEERKDICRILISAYPQGCVDGFSYKNALNYAIHFGHLDIADEMLDVIPDESLRRVLPSIEAFTDDNMIRKVLRKCGTEYIGQKCYAYIDHLVKYKKFHLYLQENPDVNILDTTGRTLLSNLCYHIAPLSYIKDVLDLHPADLNEPFFYACKTRNLEAADLLVQSGANIHYKTDEILRSFVWAFRSGSEMLDYLLSRGVAFNIDLVHYTKYERIDLIETALKHGVVPNHVILMEILDMKNESIFRKLVVLFLAHGAEYSRMFENIKSYTPNSMTAERLLFIRDESFNISLTKIAIY